MLRTNGTTGKTRSLWNCSFGHLVIDHRSHKHSSNHHDSHNLPISFLVDNSSIHTDTQRTRTDYRQEQREDKRLNAKLRIK